MIARTPGSSEIVSADAPDNAYHPHPLPSPGGVERRAVPRTRYVHGDTRTAGWLAGPIESHLCCPRGHHVRDGALAVGEYVVRCKYQQGARAPECGLRLWVLHVPRVGITFVAEVDWDDIREIRTHQTAHETLRYLGARLWPGRTP